MNSQKHKEKIFDKIAQETFSSQCLICDMQTHRSNYKVKVKNNAVLAWWEAKPRAHTSFKQDLMG